jgi:hypothetical protein
MQTASDDQPLCRRTPLLLGGIVLRLVLGVIDYDDVFIFYVTVTVGFRDKM